MDRTQLQKLVQYLVAEHHTAVLPTVQRLADEIATVRKEGREEEQEVDGAPDPTAGAADDGVEAEWHLNEEQVKAQVRDALAAGKDGVGASGAGEEVKQLEHMFTKVDLNCHNTCLIHDHECM